MEHSVSDDFAARRLVYRVLLSVTTGPTSAPLAQIDIYAVAAIFSIFKWCMFMLVGPLGHYS